MDSILLVEVQELKDRMAINPDLVGVDPPIESAIRAAQLRVEAFFDSPLSLATTVDTFFLDSEAFSGVQPGGLFRLFLNRAFLSAAPTLTFGGGWNSTYGEVPPLDYTCDLTRGIVYVDAMSYRDVYVTVSYSSGYSDIGQIPPYIKEAILAYSPIIFNIGQVTNRNQEAEAGYKVAGEHALAVLSPYTRNIGMALRPLFK
jgi:hypothetical protein